MSKHTPGTWKRIALGGSSTVVVPDRPARNDTRIPAYGYDGSKGHCIGYPFINDDNSIRLDFVCFSHADAVLISAAPDLLEACKAQHEAIDTLFAMLIKLTADQEPHCFFPSKSGQPWDAMVQGNAAIAKATQS